ncbi:plectrovirus spv1-r8a2b protein [Lasius niger]|uniref:Plectrovirus spv1-r8a2b protein n=1 Tax=Lasius niger TaxID=67767 RepID=A0A0J7NC23_LASNI|nr:plectrovirus spv1-r8a2b protein [Lasius niger]KMQ90125.1 plectrovirus spv1-r8a2b protein [Lasius niger]
MSDYPDSAVDNGLVAKALQVRSSFVNFLKKYSDVIVNELLRVQNGGSPDYDNVADGTEKVLFSFQNVDVTEASTLKTNIYQMTLTIDDQEKIRADGADLFLQQFFSNALVPIFENRSTFIESGYIDNLEYSVVMLNFFGLKNLDFVNLLADKDAQKEGDLYRYYDFNFGIYNWQEITKDGLFPAGQ